MPYTPNNPYIPGDPYSYDLKWLVTQVKANRAALDGLDERIRTIVIRELDQHDPVYYSTAQELIDSPQKAGSLAYIEGFNAAGDGGANLYYVTDDYNDIIGANFYLTMAVANLWALPIILTPYVTPEMFGAAADGTTDDTDAVQIAVAFNKPVLLKAFGIYLLGTISAVAPLYIKGYDTTINLIINDGIHASVIYSDGYDVKLEGLKFVGVIHATASGINEVNAVIHVNNASLNLSGITFQNIQPWNFRLAPPVMADRDASILKTYNTDVVIDNCNFVNCRNQEMVYINPDNSNPIRKFIFTNNYLDGCEYSITALCGYAYIDNIQGTHTYNGSLFNVFGLKRLTANNILVDIDTSLYPSASVLDNTEGGLFGSENVEINTVKGTTLIQAANITAANCDVFGINVINTTNAVLSPLTVKSAFSSINWKFYNIGRIARTGSDMLDANTEVILNIDNSTTSGLLIPQFTCVINEFKVNNSNIALPISRAASVPNKVIFTNCNITGLTPGFTAYLCDSTILFGCYAFSPITLYYSAGVTIPIIYASHNITV